jgi:hypothetical protein
MVKTVTVKLRFTSFFSGSFTDKSILTKPQPTGFTTSSLKVNNLTDQRSTLWAESILNMTAYNIP